ncbi:MAG: adenylyl-sulfate kinase [Thermodesulfovibrionales bacterium]
MTENVIWHERLVARRERNLMNKHKSGLVWFTGLSASGKSTIAHHLEKDLFDRGIRSYVLDGDNVRHGINSNLGFSREDRKENLRRIAEVSKLYVDAGIVVLAAFISPYRDDRAYVKEVVGAEDFFEIYVQCSLDVCEKRDPKGLYKKARAGIIKNYTGIDAPYEEPLNPDLTIDTVVLDIESSVKSVLTFLDERKFILLL